MTAKKKAAEKAEAKEPERVSDIPPAPPPSLDSVFGEGENPSTEQPKKRRGRPPGSKNRTKKESETTPEEMEAMRNACGQLWHVLFAIAATRLGEKWLLSQPEIDALGGASTPVVNQYLPAVSGHFPAIILGMMLVGVVGSRVAPPPAALPDGE